MKFKHNNVDILIEENVIELFQHFKQTGNKNERGGIILGEVSKNKIIIKKASIPTQFDKSFRFKFIRHKKSAQIFTDFEFYNSRGRVIYIGEWHTHPENYPSPSSTDINMIKTQFRKNKINETFLLMIIVGLKGYYLGYYDGENLYRLNNY
jgi:integrative and conjugative element protein (TIGR02256 family)